MKPYKLMCSLFAHSGDVKCLNATRDNGGFVSVSRDLTGKLWQKSESNQYAIGQTLTEHKKYVNSVVVVYSVEEYPNGLIFTGSNDQTISVHDIESNKHIATLNEHDASVCTLYVNQLDSLLYSGSFDSSAKVWDLKNLVKCDFKLASSFTLKGHAQTVWCVLGVDKQGVLLTASADKTIKHWQLSPNKKAADALVEYVGHSDCVRGLALNINNKQEFFSCSNDGNVIQWRLGQPTPLRRVHVTDSFLYSINMLNYEQNDSLRNKIDECYFLTTSEDRSVRVHHSSVAGKSGSGGITTEQTLSLPCQTVWHAVCLPNGDLAAACSDGSIRVFTQSESRFASGPEQAEYEEELARFAIPVKTSAALSQVNREDLPGIEALNMPGRMEGQPLMINNNNEIEVYQWDSASSRWVKIGVAVGSTDAAASASRSKVTYLGKEYDYVFDIELDETGSQKLKLPYNLNENPYLTAQEFIHKHELSQYFLDQIAQFIVKNTEGETIGASQGSSVYDPFTGQNRYVPPAAGYSNGKNNSSFSGGADPFTGSNAYHSGSNGRGQQTSAAPSTLPPSRNSNDFYPHLDFITFEQQNLEAIFRKLRELQQQVSADVKSDMVTDKSNIELLENLMSNLNDPYAANELNDQIDLLFQMIDVWPKETVFPLLDLARIAVLSKNVATYLFRNQSIEHLTSKKVQPNNNYYYDIVYKLIGDENLTNTMLVLRFFGNLFKSLESGTLLNTNKKLMSFVLNERSHLIHKLHTLTKLETNKGYQVAFSTLILDYVILFKKLVGLNQNFSGAYISDILVEMIEYLNEPNLTNSILNWDSEAIFRILVSVGNLLSNTDTVLDYPYLISVTKSMENFALICKEISLKGQLYPEKVVKCAEYLVKDLS